MSDLSSGSIVAGRYRIIAPLGRGGHGTIYKAFDTPAQRPVALKILASPPSDPDAIRRSLTEAVMARLEHPNILRVFDHGETDGHLYAVTQLVEGRSLDQILRDRRRLEPDAAVEIAVRVGTALTFAHWQGVIHGDIKPSNVMVSADGNVLLADFGSHTRSADAMLASTLTVFGTPAYMSPEQAMGEPLDARSDVFSLGAMFYELLTGRKWFAPGGEALPSSEIVKRVVEAEPRPVRDFVPDLRDAVSVVVHQALTKDRTRRYQSAADFVNGLLPAKAVPLGLLIESAHARHPEPPSVDADETGTAVPAYLPQSKRRVSEFASLWDELAVAAHESKDRFAALAETLIHGLVREAIGYRLCDQIPYFRGTVGYMIEAPFLWIRQSRFPLLFVAFDSQHPDLLATVLNQLATAGTTEFFALLVVVPPRGATSGREADELRRIVKNSVYRQDFVVLDREHLASIVAHNSSSRLIDIIIEQVDDLSVLSPYVVRGPVPGQMFFGRESEIKTISQGLRRGDYAVVGGRRIGKSSILLRLKRLLGDDPRYRTIYLDCEARFTDGDFFAAVREQFDTPANGESLSFRAMTARVYETSPDRQVVFLLDEIDELLAFDAERRPAGQLFKTLRAASQEGLCRFVFSGSRTLHGHLRDPKSPFFNFCEKITLGRLDDQSVHEIVQKPMRQLGIQMPDEAQVIRRLIELTSSHPNLAQWVCDRLVTSSVERRVRLETLEKVATMNDFHEQYVSTAWGDATPLEKLITLLMDGPFSWDDILRALALHGLHDKSAIRNALDFLELASLLDRTATRYRFGLAQFPRIVRDSGIVPAQIASIADEARRQCS